MLRVMMLTTDLERGGLPLRLVRLADRLRGAAIEPVVGCLAPAGPLTADLEARGIETFSCDARGPFDALCLARLARHVRRWRPDLIHASLFHANLAARLVGRLDAARPVITSTVTIEIERRWHCAVEALTAGWSDLHVVNSAAVAEHVRADLGFASDRVITIANGIDIEWIDGIPPIDRQSAGLAEDVPLVVWAGRMDPVKDLPTFVKTIAHLRGRGRVQVVLLGDGPERLHVERLIREAELASVIRMALWVDNVAGWLKAADALLFPSRTEGSPNVVIEAMLCGCPVVASDLPATRDLIDSGVHGLLCEVGHSAAFADAVATVVADGPLAGRLRREARLRAATRHDLQDITGLWRGAYERAMGCC
jgi:glycosyltransferase involved in cell wall biosynthesis